MMPRLPITEITENSSNQWERKRAQNNIARRETRDTDHRMDEMSIDDCYCSRFFVRV